MARKRAASAKLACRVAAQAQPIEGPYLGVAGGLALPQNVRVTPDSSSFGARAAPSP